MEFKDFLSKISKIKTIIEEENYEKKKFQLKMTPKERLDFDMKSIKNPKKAAVLALFYPKNNKTYFLLTLRADYKGTHASQISFPGGKFDNLDKDLIHTALREANEEVGVKSNSINTIIPLSNLYIPPSNFWVNPYVGITAEIPKFTKNYEVAELLEVCLDDLLNDDFVIYKNISTSYANNIEVPCFLLNNYVVWGATAMILSELKEIIKIAMS